MKVKVEACIQGDLSQEACRYAAAAFRGGADTIELCGAMHREGLTPPESSIVAARAEFRRAGLMVMIRPRDGDFHCSNEEVAEMKCQMEAAAKAGADGVVFGILTSEGRIDERQLEKLMELCRVRGLRTTFHRAFDAANDPVSALESLIGLGFERVLTSGFRWGQSGSAFEGVDQLNRTIQQSEGRIEIVIGGGVNCQNAPLILQKMSPWNGPISVHAYSGVQEAGETTEAGIRKLAEAVAPWNEG